MLTGSREADLEGTGNAAGADEEPPDLTEDRRTRWDARHAAHDPIETIEADPSLEEEVAPLTPGRALDLGTGDGRNAVWLAQHGWQVTGVDFSSVGLERARTWAQVQGVTISWKLADLLAWQPPAQAFDLVVLFFTPLPLAERRTVHRAAAEAVTQGGTLLIVGHDRSNLERGVGGPQDPAVLFNAAEIASELPGLTVRRAAAVRRSVGGNRWRIDTLVRAERPIHDART